METICLKIEEKLLNEVDSALKDNRYSTRTEFIRDAIRRRLTSLEKDKIIKQLASYKGKLKGKKGDKESGELAFKELAEKIASLN